MKAFVLQTAFGLDHLALRDWPDPTPGPNQLVVRVRAAALNYRDLLVAKGQYNPKLAIPRILGSDAAGDVVAIGAEVAGWKIGDRAAGCFFQEWSDGPITEAAAKSALGGERQGTIAEYVVYESDAAVRIPDHLSFEEAACLPCAAVTAWNALAAASTGPGTTVLLQGTGGVSIFALQLANALGARSLITSSSDDKLSRALALGAAAGTNYKANPDWEKWARQQTGGTGVDVVVEVGGPGTLDRSLKAVRTGGHVALIGVLAGPGSFNPLLVLMKAIRLQGVFVGSRAMLEALNRILEEKQIRPVIDRTFPLAEAADAFRYLEGGSHFGKVVIRT
jgi:NADPH:quinone reductase-like Zn-dependent oxidoreductase